MYGALIAHARATEREKVMDTLDPKYHVETDKVYGVAADALYYKEEGPLFFTFCVTLLVSLGVTWWVVPQIMEVAVEPVRQMTGIAVEFFWAGVGFVFPLCVGAPLFFLSKKVYYGPKYRQKVGELKKAGIQSSSARIVLEAIARRDRFHQEIALAALE
ncbi:MAG: hypothetical protein AAB869_03095 [Patescibacteria group bacterium]